MGQWQTYRAEGPGGVVLGRGPSTSVFVKGILAATKASVPLSKLRPCVQAEHWGWLR